MTQMSNLWRAKLSAAWLRCSRRFNGFGNTGVLGLSEI
jgi:hypothetical protein